MGLPDGVDAVFAAREIQTVDRLPVTDLDCDVSEVSNGDRDNLAEGECDNCEIVSADAKGRGADHQTKCRGDDGAKPDHVPKSPLKSHKRRIEYSHRVG